jgi:hypothetical protein
MTCSVCRRPSTARLKVRVVQLGDVRVQLCAECERSDWTRAEAKRRAAQ